MTVDRITLVYAGTGVSKTATAPSLGLTSGLPLFHSTKAVMLQLFSLLTDKSVVVIGDVMLDAYLSGAVERISPEAPVPIVKAASERFVPGGAANVAANLATLGTKVSLVGYVGSDRSRESLLAALEEHPGVDAGGLVTVADRITTCKLRIGGTHQQIVRVDREDCSPADADSEAALIRIIWDRIAQADVVVLSDYGKGVCTDAVLRAAIERATVLDRTIIVDPKRKDFSAYRGATILTPNRLELSAATGRPCETDDEAAAAAAVAQAACGAHLLLTRSEKGMSLFPRAGEPLHLPTLAQDVFDVSGAGDTVVATLAAGAAVNLPIADCMRMANHAAGIVVAKRGTATVSQQELARAMLIEPMQSAPEAGGLLDLETAIGLRTAWQRERLTVGLANGCFDLLHPGHTALIRQAADRCDRLLIALNSDTSVRRLKGPDRPIQDEQARAQVIGALKGVAGVILFDDDTPLALIEALRPDLLVKGADYKLADVVGADIVQARGGRVLLVPLEAGHSTTSLAASAAGR